MVVRDESGVIERCLESVRPLIDTWVICDTGSVDGTPDLVARSLAGIPGELLHREWRDFGHNRTELLKLAKGRADYLLLIDADMTVTYDRTSLLDLAADSYLLRHDEPVEYWIKRLVRGDRDWRYEGRTHEHILTEPPDVATKSDAIVIHHHADGGSRSDKFERDLRLLAADLRDDPANARSVFYLAQTYRDLGRTDDAIAQYERRAEMGGWDEEVFYSTFQAGVLRAERGNWPVGMAVLIAAWELRPSRLEPVYELASRLRVRGEYESAHLFALRGVDRPPPNDILFVSRWVYRWGLLFEYSITSYWVGEVQAALNACRRLLAFSDLPENYRSQTETNMQFCLERMAERRAPRKPVAPVKRRR